MTFYMIYAALTAPQCDKPTVCETSCRQQWRILISTILNSCPLLNNRLQTYRPHRSIYDLRTGCV